MLLPKTSAGELPQVTRSKQIQPIRKRYRTLGFNDASAYMGWEAPILSQNSGGLTAQRGLDNFRGGVTKDVVCAEVRAHPVAFLPGFDFLAHGDYLPSHVRAWNDTRFPGERKIQLGELDGCDIVVSPNFICPPRHGNIAILLNH